jgi:serine/threonine protein kinase
MLHQQQIGKGGNAVVYQAMDPTHPSEKMVVKVIRITDEHKRAIIERELSIIEELPPHPNIVKTWPIRCFSERNYYIFMEMCEGGTLSMELNRRLRQGFTENDILNIAYQLVQGYNVLYAHKIIHLDIKPDNILISKGQFKLADFGLAVLENPLQVARKEGTKTYMSP